MTEFYVGMRFLQVSYDSRNKEVYKIQEFTITEISPDGRFIKMTIHYGTDKPQTRWTTVDNMTSSMKAIAKEKDIEIVRLWNIADKEG